jgi:hypothetical protein
MCIVGAHIVHKLSNKKTFTAYSIRSHCDSPTVLHHMHMHTGNNSLQVGPHESDGQTVHRIKNGYAIELCLLFALVISFFAVMVATTR